MELLSAIALGVSVGLVGVVAGAEVASLLIQKAMDRMPLTHGRPAVQRINKTMGGVMPVLIPITVVVTLLSGVLHLPAIAGYLSLVAAVALVGMILITVIAMKPLNQLEESADDSTPEAEWRKLRQDWNRLNGWRATCDLTALAFAVASVWAA